MVKAPMDTVREAMRNAVFNELKTAPAEVLWQIVDQKSEWADSDWPRPAGRVDPAVGTVAIVGKGLGSAIVPWGEPGYEFWGLNDHGGRDAPVECYTRWFQLHNPAYLQRHYPEGIQALERTWGTLRGVALLMDQTYDWLPDSTPFPKEEVEQLTPRGWYHCSSFDWMVALAIHEGWKRIEIYDVSFYTFPVTLNGEPISGRPCLEYWIGVAEGRGIEVEVIRGGDTFQNLHVALYSSRLQYGFEREPALDLSEGDDGWSDVR